MTSSAKIAFALAILMGFASFPANASPVGECTPWKPLLGTACKTQEMPRRRRSLHSRNGLPGDDDPSPAADHRP